MTDDNQRGKVGSWVAENQRALIIAAVLIALFLLYAQASASAYQACLLEAQVNDEFIDGCDRWNVFSSPS